MVVMVAGEYVGKEKDAPILEGTLGSLSIRGVRSG